LWLIYSTKYASSKIAFPENLTVLTLTNLLSKLYTQLSDNKFLAIPYNFSNTQLYRLDSIFLNNKGNYSEDETAQYNKLIFVVKELHNKLILLSDKLELSDTEYNNYSAIISVLYKLEPFFQAIILVSQSIDGVKNANK
jgi:hypothetical protein